MTTKPVKFNTETIYARELNYAEYEDFTKTLNRDDNVEPTEWERERVDLMLRFAVRKDGSQRFPDRTEIDTQPSKVVRKAAYAFYRAFEALNFFTKDDIAELQKN